MPRLLVLVVIPLALIAATLSGCTATTELPPPEPTREGEPLFATDEEALAAATAAYEEYLAVIDAALADPAQDADFSLVAEGQALMELESSRREFVEQGYMLQGSRVLGGVELQQSFELGNVVTVIAYFCEDISSVTLWDEEGISLTTEDRPNLSIFEASIAFEMNEYRVTDRQFWENVESC